MLLQVLRAVQVAEIVQVADALEVGLQLRDGAGGSVRRLGEAITASRSDSRMLSPRGAPYSDVQKG